MIGYVTVGTSSMEKAKQFYSELLSEMGASVVMDLGNFAAFGNAPGATMFAVCEPFNKEAPTPGNGNMVAMAPGSIEQVDSLYAKALALGGTDEGAPGARGDGFYGAYFRDLDGNKLCFFHIG
ncbi:MAG: catechol 2,3-dioxygenase-like lactoylglutathione lyase family enzyme [Halioglobus sp.]|jgi:catechol 2,3-dioxygenase-like lactoylglutathione lyase family enzyme